MWWDPNWGGGGPPSWDGPWDGGDGFCNGPAEPRLPQAARDEMERLCRRISLLQDSLQAGSLVGYLFNKFMRLTFYQRLFSIYLCPADAAGAGRDALRGAGGSGSSRN